MKFAIALLVSLASVSASAQTVQLKNFREYFESLKVVAHIVSPTPGLNQDFGLVKERLPKWGRLPEFTASAQLAMLQLSSSACKEMITSDASLPASYRWAHSMVDFAGTSAQFQTNVGAQLLTRYAELFWQRELTANEEGELLNLFRDLSTATVQETLILTCSVFATSPDFFVL